MSNDLCSQLEAVMIGQYGLPTVATSFLGFHLFYMGALQDHVFREEYYASTDVNLRVICVKLYFSFPSCMTTDDPFDKIAIEEMRAACRGIPNMQSLITDDVIRQEFATRRLGMLYLIQQKAVKLFAVLSRKPDFPSFTAIQAIPSSDLARVWARIVGLEEVLEGADALSGKLPANRTAKYVEERTQRARWLALCVRDFMHAGIRNQLPKDTGAKTSSSSPPLHGSPSAP